MFSTFLKEVNSYFDRRFFLSAFFPVLAFSGLSLGMIFGVLDAGMIVDLWKKQSAELQVLIVVAVLSLILFIAFLFHIYQTHLIRFYEGHWDQLPILNTWGKLRRVFYQTRWDYFDKEARRYRDEIKELEGVTTPNKAKIQQLRRELRDIEKEWFRALPWQRDKVESTRLGNALAVAELYPMQRYNLDSSLAWPRLQTLLPKEYLDGLRDAKANLDLLLVFTTLSWVFALGWGTGLIIFPISWKLFLIANFAWILALISYSAVLQAADVYGELFRAAFDLYRWKIIEALHLKLPNNYEAERKLWGEINDFLYRNFPPDEKVFVYDVKLDDNLNDPGKPD